MRRSTRADASHNLELTKILWGKARQARPNKEGSDPDDKKDQNKPEPKQPDEKTSGGAEPSPGKTEPLTTGDPQHPDPRDPRQPIPVDNMHAPGAGNLPPVPDKGDRTPMPPEDAARHLERAFERVLRERRKHQLDMAAGRRRDIPDY